MAFTGLAFYSAMIYVVFYAFKIREFRDIRNDLRTEVFNRVSENDESCRNVLLGGALRFYRFNEDEIQKLLDRAAKNMNQREQNE